MESKTSSTTNKTKRQRHDDRVTLDVETLQRMDAWIEQVKAATKGVTVSRKDLVNWMVRQHDSHLSPDELTALRSKFFDEVRFLQQTIREVKAARQQGGEVNLAALLVGAEQKRALGSRRLGRSRKRSGDPSHGGQALELPTAERTKRMDERTTIST